MGLINQLWRPIDRAQTLKAPHFTTSQSVTSPIAENNINGTSDNEIFTSFNDIINKPTPSINRALPTTPMARMNTTLRVLATENSFLNAKFESLESKLYGEIRAIKSFFHRSAPIVKKCQTKSHKQRAGLQYQHWRNNYPEK